MASRKVAIVIPSFGELDYFPRTLASLAESAEQAPQDRGRLTVIVVVNHPRGAFPGERRDSEQTLSFLEEQRESYPYRLVPLGCPPEGLALGVGEARKIGMDYAVNQVLTLDDDLVVSLDADCAVAPNYIETLFSHPLQGAGFTIYFEHRIEEANDPGAIALYELYLRYIRFQLEKAESAFAFHTVGSCMGTNARFYKLSGGMPAKTATEDFHFLNKLRKLGAIETWNETCVYPSTRISQKVYLGTGHFLTAHVESATKAFESLMLPSPAAFARLKTIHRAMRAYYLDSAIASEIDAEKLVAWEEIETLKQNCATEGAFLHRLPQVFDGLKTWRLLRRLSELESRPGITEFLSWCGQICESTASDPVRILHNFRQLERATRRSMDRGTM